MDVEDAWGCCLSKTWLGLMQGRLSAWHCRGTFGRGNRRIISSFGMLF